MAEEDSFRKIVARSAALVGKCKTLKADRPDLKVVLADIQSEWRTLKAEVKEFKLLERRAMEDPVAQLSESEPLKLATISSRIGVHQRTRPPPPTTKTKRPKARHKSG